MKTFFASSILLFGGVLFFGACSNGDGNGSDASSDAAADTGAQGCTTDDECTQPGQLCFFAITGGCTLQGNQGKCITYSQPATCTPNVACTCSGDTVTVCAPDGYINFPSRTSGPCPGDDGGPEASVDAGDDASDASPE